MWNVVGSGGSVPSPPTYVAHEVARMRRVATQTDLAGQAADAALFDAAREVAAAARDGDVGVDPAAVSWLIGAVATHRGIEDEAHIVSCRYWEWQKADNTAAMEDLPRPAAPHPSVALLADRFLDWIEASGSPARAAELRMALDAVEAAPADLPAIGRWRLLLAARNIAALLPDGVDV